MTTWDHFLLWESSANTHIRMRSSILKFPGASHFVAWLLSLGILQDCKVTWKTPRRRKCGVWDRMMRSLSTFTFAGEGLALKGHCQLFQINGDRRTTTNGFFINISTSMYLCLCQNIYWVHLLWLRVGT